MKVITVQIDLLCDTCSFLDPRFKDHFNLEHIALHALLGEVQSIDVVHQPTEPENNPNVPKPVKKGKFSQVFVTRSASTMTPTLSVPERLKREVDMYMQSPVLDIDASPLNWWRVEWKRMPLLAVVAQKYVGICATSILAI